MTSKEEKEIKELLERESARINRPEFIGNDPVKFPRMFTDPRDIEITALLTSSIAWGKREMICRNCMKMLNLMDLQPYRYVIDEGYEELPDGNIHRTFFTSDMKHYLRGLRLVYNRYGSLEGLAGARRVSESPYPAASLAEALNQILREANGKDDSRCLPLNLETTALKRLNMALRWLVRDDGIVDMGIWKTIRPAQLFIPLDVHVGNVSRSLGLLKRKSNDRKAVEELTKKLREYCPEDPVKYDFALFGLGIENSSIIKSKS